MNWIKNFQGNLVHIGRAISIEKLSVPLIAPQKWEVVARFHVSETIDGDIFAPYTKKLGLFDSEEEANEYLLKITPKLIEE